VLAAEQITTALFQRKAKGSFSQDSDRAPPPRVAFRTLAETRRRGGPHGTLPRLSPRRMDPQAWLAFGIDVLRETVSRLSATPDAWLGPARSPGSKSNSPTTARASVGGSPRASSRPVVLLDFSPRGSRSTRIAVSLGHVKTNTARHSSAASLYRLAFDDVVSDLLKVKAATVAETTSRPVARPIRPRTSPQPRSRRATSRPTSGRKS